MTPFSPSSPSVIRETLLYTAYLTYISLPPPPGRHFFISHTVPLHISLPPSPRGISFSSFPSYIYLSPSVTGEHCLGPIHHPLPPPLDHAPPFPPSLRVFLDILDSTGLPSSSGSTPMLAVAPHACTYLSITPPSLLRSPGILATLALFFPLFTRPPAAHGSVFSFLFPHTPFSCSRSPPLRVRSPVSLVCLLCLLRSVFCAVSCFVGLLSELADQVFCANRLAFGV